MVVLSDAHAHAPAPGRPTLTIDTDLPISSTGTMGGPNKDAEWKQDAQAGADPSVLPEYTLLPASPAAGAASPPPPLPPRSHPTPAPTPSTPSEGKHILRAVARGLAALVLPPFILTAAALAAAAAMLYGCGKMLEGIGRGLAAGPELLYKGCVSRKAKRVWGALRGAGPRDVETGAIAI
ncbi:hypothetical protein C8Q78DRAFT_992788 [Trametes maxima]|nr:hypothetical protein C8Q78DRAFT_992788 [Trametes maxima]